MLRLGKLLGALAVTTFGCWSDYHQQRGNAQRHFRPNILRESGKYPPLWLKLVSNGSVKANGIVSPSVESSTVYYHSSLTLILWLTALMPVQILLIINRGSFSIYESKYLVPNLFDSPLFLSLAYRCSRLINGSST
jgi:hypothetical protein